MGRLIVERSYQENPLAARRAARKEDRGGIVCQGKIPHGVEHSRADTQPGFKLEAKALGLHEPGSPRSWRHLGGVSDHVHLYLECPKDVAISSLANIIKTTSTKWIRDTFQSSQNFHWQSGYSAFSVDARNDRRLRDYIRNQEIHHARISFDFEYKRFLEEYAIDHDERYVLG